MSGLEHRALFYEGTDEFMAAAFPFVREGIDAGDPIIAVVNTQNMEALREALGADAAAVDLHDSDDWYVSPGKAYSGYIGYLVEHSDASCVRLVGEPIWPVDWNLAVAEWAHYETVFNVVAKDAPLRAMCPYRIDALPDVILEHARATHPEVHTRNGVQPSGAYVDPHAFCSHLAAQEVLPVARARSFPITNELGALRALVQAEAVEAGVPRGRLPEFLIAVHEVAMNAVTHGGGNAVARTWADERSFVCEVRDYGPGLSETLAGYLPPERGKERGRGLWLARQICDYVQVLSRDGETQVRLHVKRG